MLKLNGEFIKHKRRITYTRKHKERERTIMNERNFYAKKISEKKIRNAHTHIRTNCVNTPRIYLRYIKTLTHTFLHLYVDIFFYSHIFL